MPAHSHLVPSTAVARVELRERHDRRRTSVWHSSVAQQRGTAAWHSSVAQQRGTAAFDVTTRHAAADLRDAARTRRMWLRRPTTTQTRPTPVESSQVTADARQGAPRYLGTGDRLASPPDGAHRVGVGPRVARREDGRVPRVPQPARRRVGAVGRWVEVGWWVGAAVMPLVEAPFANRVEALWPPAEGVLCAARGAHRRGPRGTPPSARAGAWCVLACGAVRAGEERVRWRAARRAVGLGTGAVRGGAGTHRCRTCNGRCTSAYGSPRPSARTRWARFGRKGRCGGGCRARRRRWRIPTFRAPSPG
jgi:hypothetical protein